MAKTIFVLALFVACLGLLSAKTLRKRQLPPQPPAPINFQTEWYRIYQLLMQTQYAVFQCRARLIFNDQNPVLVFDAPDTTEAPLEPPAATASTPVNAAKRQVPGQNPPLAFWQVMEINRLLDRYDAEYFQLQQCQYQLQSQAGAGAGGGAGTGGVAFQG